MKKVIFIKTYTVKAHNGQTYEEGAVHEFDDAGALHFIKRNLAVEVLPECKEEVTEPEIPPDQKAPEPAPTNKQKADPVEKFKKAQRAYRKKELAK